MAACRNWRCMTVARVPSVTWSAHCRHCHHGRVVLVLHDIEGWKHQEIAEQLQMAVGSSKAQLHRARGLLRARLGDMT